jgi:hypothetical protein
MPGIGQMWDIKVPSMQSKCKVYHTPLLAFRLANVIYLFYQLHPVMKKGSKNELPLDVRY